MADQNKSLRARIEQILQGIDTTDYDDPEGWWETSTGAEFGAAKKAELLAALERPAVPEGWRKDGAALVPLYAAPPDARLRALEEALQRVTDRLETHSSSSGCSVYDSEDGDAVRVARALARGGEHE